MKVILTPEQKESLKSKVINLGHKNAVKLFGDEKKILELVFDGDVREMLEEFSKKPPYIIMEDKLFIHGLFIPGWDLFSNNDYSYFLGRYLVNFQKRKIPMMVTMQKRGGPYHRVEGVARLTDPSRGTTNVTLSPTGYHKGDPKLSQSERNSVFKKIIKEYNLDYPTKFGQGFRI
jgi:hypothetical protein